MWSSFARSCKAWCEGIRILMWKFLSCKSRMFKIDFSQNLSFMQSSFTNSIDNDRKAAKKCVVALLDPLVVKEKTGLSQNFETQSFIVFETDLNLNIMEVDKYAQPSISKSDMMSRMQLQNFFVVDSAFWDWRRMSFNIYASLRRRVVSKMLSSSSLGHVFANIFLALLDGNISARSVRRRKVVFLWLKRGSDFHTSMCRSVSHSWRLWRSDRQARTSNTTGPLPAEPPRQL